MRHAATAPASKPTAQLPDSVFLRALGTPEINKAPPQTGSLALRATEEWERCICKAFAILNTPSVSGSCELLPVTQYEGV